MDSWRPEQAHRMQLGGNEPFTAFLESYSPPDEGGYSPGLAIPAKYSCWAAKQYREKLDAAVDGKQWIQSSPPPASLQATPDLASSATISSPGLRVSRASNRTATLARGGSASPAPSNHSFGSPSTLDEAADRKANNDAFFSGLGQVNASRPLDLPPSQGGRYAGFGNTSTAPPASQHPSYGMSSAAAPSLSDFQENPVAALGKGWSLFSAAVMGASKVVHENVIQPGVAKVTDPTFIEGVKGYASEAGRVAGDIGKNANDWSKTQLGVDVAGQVGGLVTTVKGATGISTGRPQASGYDAVGQHDEETSALYSDTPEDDFFAQHDASFRDTAARPHATASVPAHAAKKDDEWEEW